MGINLVYVDKQDIEKYRDNSFMLSLIPLLVSLVQSQMFCYIIILICMDYANIFTIYTLIILPIVIICYRFNSEITRNILKNLESGD